MIANRPLSKLLLVYLALLSPAAAPAQSSIAPSAGTQTVTGVVTNRTTGKPSSADDVVLVQLAQGMQELARTKTDARGHFSIKVPSDGLHLLRVTHDRANYFKPIQPGSRSIDMDVYTAAAEVDNVTVSEDVMQIQTSPDGNTLRVVEHFLLKNDSQPQKTLFSDHPFEIYLPQGATVDGSTAKAPGGMGVEQPLVPMGDPNHYTILFPIRPGETEFNVWYRIPYKDTFTFGPRPTMPTEALGIMMPKSMNFKPAVSTPFQTVGDEAGLKAQAYLARNVQPSQPLGFTVTGKGELPRDTSAQAGNNAPPATNADPNTDTRPGGGLGTPLDKDADRDPWTKYRWYIIGGGGLLMFALAGFMLSRTGVPSDPSSAMPAVVRTAPGAPHRQSTTALDVLRDEMFALETDRLAGKLTDGQYTDLKSAYDTVLRRALERSRPELDSAPTA